MSAPADVRVRRMVAADLEDVLDIAAGLAQAPQWSRAAWEAVLDLRHALRRVALVAEIHEKPAGFAVASVVGPDAELETIAVAREWQRRGVARGLWAELEAELRRAGARVTLLEVRASNREALGLYASVGFVESGRRKGYYDDPAEDAVMMRLELR
ncbi:MAG TPA: ribosomal protein S18-alanine N-acetyltransferase [Terracidiphilus sp.]|nr:ribosomal protein S18-alanine N-acetyltransferase [Terracidiphilus sp.]